MSEVFKRGRLATAVKVALLAVTTVGAWSTATVEAAVAAQHSAVRSFDIPGGSLTEVLCHFASAAGAAIS
ncbi:hypothetical protein NL318_28655, partial [Klebsiella pneumoniae]|nr:hypothetical protein [Klebsiella pneumoniae]